MPSADELGRSSATSGADRDPGGRHGVRGGVVPDAALGLFGVVAVLLVPVFWSF
jgi:hypothetical protein